MQMMKRCIKLNEKYPMTLGLYLIRADLDACQCENAETTEEERCLAQILPAHAALRGPPQHEAAAHAAAQAPGRRQVHHHHRHRAVAVPVRHQLVHLTKNICNAEKIFYS